jgi:hypothetical protein
MSILFAALSMAGVHQASAVELLISGDFETPGGSVGDIPGWDLEEFATGSAQLVNSASVTGGADVQLFLRAFEGGGPLHERQGNFDNDGLPRGDVDGVDFLAWQRNFGKTSGALPSEGDATGAQDGGPDGAVLTNDFNLWKANFGAGPPLLTNARISQTVPASPGETYSFQGTSMFEDNYSGFVTTLGADSPHGQIPSPTVTQFRMEFLDTNGAVVGAPTVLDLRTEQNFPGFPVIHTPLTAQAPPGTFNVRVTAEALDMAWNGTATSEGNLQSAFFNDFSLTTAADPGTDLLTNGNLDQGPPDALDFWNQVEVPATRDEILRTPIQPFSNHTPGGTRGVWLSAFFGEHSLFEPDPVDGIISQTVQAVAGATYTFSGWTKFEPNYSGGVDTISPSGGGFLAGQPSPTSTEIKLEFLDVNSAVIGSAVIDVEAARKALGGGVANDEVWRQHILQAVSPAGTRFARLTAQMLDGVFNTDPKQSAFFDDFSLDGPAPPISAVPEPSSLVALAIGAALVGLGGRRRR